MLEYCWWEHCMQLDVISEPWCYWVSTSPPEKEQYKEFTSFFHKTICVSILSSRYYWGLVIYIYNNNMVSPWLSLHRYIFTMRSDIIITIYHLCYAVTSSTSRNYVLPTHSTFFLLLFSSWPLVGSLWEYCASLPQRPLLFPRLPPFYQGSSLPLGLWL